MASRVAAAIRQAAGPRTTSVACYVAFAVAAGLVAYWKAYSQFQPYDDEGYVLLSLKEFLHHGALYNHVFSQYGPFPFEFWGAIYKLLGATVTPDNARVMVIVLWVAIGLLIGVTVERVTGSLVIGLIAAVAGFQCCNVITNEVLIPDDLTTLLELAIVAVAALGRARPPLRAALIGALVAATLLTKINSGGCALLAVCLALAACWSQPRLRRRASWLLVLAGTAVPLVLMLRDLGHTWAQDFALVIVLGIGALGLTLGPQHSPGRDPDAVDGLQLRLFVLALAAALLLIAIVIVALGTTPGALIHGVIIGPLGQRNGFFIPYDTKISAVDLSVFGFVCAAVTRRAAARAPVSALPGVARTVISVAILLWAAGEVPISITPDPTTLGVAMPFTWLVLRPPRLGPGEDEHRFARLILAAMPLYCVIVAYPVAGSQLGYAATLFVPAAGVILADGVRQLRAWIAEQPGLGTWPQAGAGIAGIALLALLSYQALFQQAVSEAQTYSSLKPLPFYGTSRLRQAPSDVADLAGIVTVLRSRCDTFVTWPGMDSFYLWTGMNPPTGLNVTAWVNILDAKQQQRVVDAVNGTPRLCLVHNPTLEGNWETSGPPPQRPLLQFVSSGFKPIFQANGYTVSIRSR
jgi:hypothetical protein